VRAASACPGRRCNVWFESLFEHRLATRVVGCARKAPGLRRQQQSSTLTDQAARPSSRHAAGGQRRLPGQGHFATLRRKLNLPTKATCPVRPGVGAEWLYTRTRAAFTTRAEPGGPTRIGPTGVSCTTRRPPTTQLAGVRPRHDHLGRGLRLVGDQCGVSCEGVEQCSFNNAVLATESDKGGGNAITLSLSSNTAGFAGNWPTPASRPPSEPADLVDVELELQLTLDLQPERGRRCHSAYLTKDPLQRSDQLVQGLCRQLQDHRRRVLRRPQGKPTAGPIATT